MTKQLLLLFVCAIFFIDVACAQKIKLPYPSQVAYISETENSMLLDVTVYNCKPKECIYYANMDAIYEVLFIGIVDSKRYAKPFLSSAQEDDPYLQGLFNNGGFNSFIVSNKMGDKGKTKDKQKYYNITVNVNMKALKASLARNNKINTFGIY